MSNRDDGGIKGFFSIDVPTKGVLALVTAVATGGGLALFSGERGLDEVLLDVASCPAELEQHRESLAAWEEWASKTFGDDAVLLPASIYSGGDDR